MPTRSDLRAIVRRDPDLTTDAISNADLNTVLNEGALDLAQRGDAFIRTATFSSVASTQEYVLSGASAQVSNFLDLYYPAGAMSYTDANSKVKVSPNHFTIVSEKWLNLHLPAWRDASASDTLQHVYLAFDSNGYLVLGVYPKSKTAITNAFKLWYKSRGADMSGDGNYPWTNSTTNLTHTEPWQKAIAHYASWRIHAEITKKATKAEEFLALYVTESVELKEAQAKLFAGQLEGLDEEGLLQAADSFGGL